MPDFQPFSYVYLVGGAGGGAGGGEWEEFERCTSEFSPTRVDEYNWNYLDQHVCGYPDFEELAEVCVLVLSACFLYALYST